MRLADGAPEAHGELSSEVRVTEAGALDILAQGGISPPGHGREGAAGPAGPSSDHPSRDAAACAAGPSCGNVAGAEAPTTPVADGDDEDSLPQT